MRAIIQDEKLGEIVYEENSFTGKKKISINGVECVKVKKRVFELNTEEGTKEIVLKGNAIIGLTLESEGREIILIEKIKWYEIILGILPILLVITWGNNVALCKIV